MKKIITLGIVALLSTLSLNAQNWVSTKPENKKVIVFVDELSSDVSLEKDDVKEFLNNQVEPEGEKIEIPVKGSEKNDLEDSEGSVESAEK